MNPKLSELTDMINGAVKSNPDPRQRTKALKACLWRLRGPNGEFVGLRGFTCSFVPESQALVFDCRDNEAMKLACYERTLGELTIEILPQIVCAS